MARLRDGVHAADQTSRHSAPTLHGSNGRRPRPYARPRTPHRDVKMALAYAVDHADGDPVTNQHILLGMLSVPDSVAARILTELDVR